MIDGIKISDLPVNINVLLENELLDFVGKYDRKTSEAYNCPLFAEYNGLKFLIRDNSKQIKKNPDINLKYRTFVNLNGSLHKYFNNGLHNYNDFYYSSLQNVISDLLEKFKIDPNRTILNNVEFGVNLILDFDPDILLNSIINHMGIPFKQFNIDGARGIECKHTDYYIKIYNKSHQYKLSYFVLRYEIKAIKREFFNRNGIKLNYLSDLLDTKIYLKLGTILNDCFNEILFYDSSIDLNKLNAEERDILKCGRYGEHWKRLKPKSKDFTGTNKKRNYENKRRVYYNELDKFKNLQIKYSTSTMQKDVSLLIENKCKELANFDYVTGDKITDLLNICSDNEKDKITNIQTDPQNNQKGQNNTSDIVLDCPITSSDNLVRICPISKLDISMQKPESKFLCITGIKYYYDNEIDIYIELSKRLSSKWSNEPLKIQFREIAHSIRNENNDKILDVANNFKRSYKKISENCLFDSTPYIQPKLLSLLSKRNSIYN